MAPEVVYHRIGFFAFRAVVPYACQIASENLTDTIFDAFLHETVDKFVHSISMSHSASSIEHFQSLGCVSIIDIFERGLMFCNASIPVPPVREHFISTVGNRGISSIDDCGNRIANSNIHISFGLSTYLTNLLSLYGLMGNPMFAIVDEFEFSLLTTPSKFTFNPAFELERECNLLTFDFVILTFNNIDELELASISIFPIAWRLDLSNMRWKCSFSLLLQQSKEGFPSIGVFSDDLLCGSTPDPTFELVIEILGLPVNLALEKALPTPVIKLVPERSTTCSSIYYDFRMLEYDFECIASVHSNITSMLGSMQMFVGEMGESNLSEGGPYPAPKEAGFRPQKRLINSF